MANLSPDTARPPLSPPPPVYLRSSPPPPPPPPPQPVSMMNDTSFSAPWPPVREAIVAPPSLTQTSERKIARKPVSSDKNAIIQTAPRSPIRVDQPFDLPQASSALMEDLADLENPGNLMDTKDAIDSAFITPELHRLSLYSNYYPNRSSSLPQPSSPLRPSSPPRSPSPPRSTSPPAMQPPQQHSYHKPTPSTGSWSIVEPNEREEESASGEKRESLGHEEGSLSYRPSTSSQGSLQSTEPPTLDYRPLQYHHQDFNDEPIPRSVSGLLGRSPASLSAEHLTASNVHLAPGRASYGGHTIPRPMSAYSSASDLVLRGRTRSPQHSPAHHVRGASSHSSASPDVRPMSSFIDLLTAPYPQPSPSPANLNNTQLRLSLGNNVSLLSHKQTFEMYLANVKKTNDSAVQYEFAVFMVNAVQEMTDLDDGASTISSEKDPDVTRHRLLSEARSILQRLADRGYPYAQYYLADGYASGLFNKGKEDHERAFHLFVAASKHGHVEASYRAALCYEFGWGCRIDAAKAVQHYRQAAAKNHPGAMLRLGRACLTGDMGLGKRYREGIKWLKRAAESADAQYNSGPYELGILHETGFGDDVFPDLGYAAQLLTKSAELGHAEANYRLGDAYEHGKLNCPRDPALSIHFYTGAAQAGHALAMMALCAWYIVGAEPVLEKDETEAYEWALRAAKLGLAKAQYAVGYFTEMGIGCRRDPLEANVWYVKAADQGDERAKHRIGAIQAAAEGADPRMAAVGAIGEKYNEKRLTKVKESAQSKSKRFGIF